MALEITDATFEEQVLKSDKPVMVDFWAAWCGPCRMVGPIIEDISNEYEGRAVVGKLDVDANQEYAAKYGVRNIPTVLIFQNGEVVGRQVGVAPKNTYAEALDALLKEVHQRKTKKGHSKEWLFFLSYQVIRFSSYQVIKLSRHGCKWDRGLLGRAAIYRG